MPIFFVGRARYDYFLKRVSSCLSDRSFLRRTSYLSFLGTPLLYRFYILLQEKREPKPSVFQKDYYHTLSMSVGDVDSSFLPFLGFCLDLPRVPRSLEKHITPILSVVQAPTHTEGKEKISCACISKYRFFIEKTSDFLQ